MKKIKLNKFEVIGLISLCVFGVIYILWLLGFFLHFLTAVKTHDYSVLLICGQTALTLFGFTLVGAIFERRTEEPKKIIKKLFNTSILFLVTAIAFFFMYLISPLIEDSSITPTSFLGITIVIAFSMALFIGFVGFIGGFLYLFYILIEYRASLE